MKKPSLFSRTEKKMLWCVGASCGLIVAGAVFSARTNAEPKWNLPPVIVPQNNGYDVYVKAAKTIRWSKPMPDPVDDYQFTQLTPAQRSERYSLARRRAWLKANAAGFAMFERAQKLESRNPIPYADYNGKESALRTLARFKAAQANTFALEKRWTAATDAALDDVELGFDMARGGPLMSRFAGSVCVAIGLLPLESPTIMENLQAEEARAALLRLDNLLAERPTYAEAFKVERWHGVAFWQRTMKNPRWRNEFFRPRCNMMGGTAKTPNALDKVGEKAGIAVLSFGMGVAAPNRTIVENHHRVYDWIDINMSNSYGTILTPEPESLDLMTGFYTAGERGKALNFRRFQEARELTKLRLIALRLALQIHRKQSGAYPATLDELRPILPNVPLDPFTDGKPFGYRREGANTRLWSVGPDGRDDGGKPIVKPVSSSKPSGGPPGMKELLPDDRPITVRDDSRGDWVATYNR